MSDHKHLLTERGVNVNFKTNIYGGYRMNHATAHGELKIIQPMFFCVDKREYSRNLLTIAEYFRWMGGKR